TPSGQRFWSGYGPGTPGTSRSPGTAIFCDPLAGRRLTWPFVPAVTRTRGSVAGPSTKTKRQPKGATDGWLFLERRQLASVVAASQFRDVLGIWRAACADQLG